MSKDLNKVQVIGRLGADPEIKYTDQGSAIARMSIASSRSWRTAEGETREDTEWFRVVAWNKLGEICAQYLKKGSKVYIEGRLQTRSWDDQTGQKRYMTEVVANDMIMLDSKQTGPANMDDAPDMGYDNEPEMEPEAAPPPRSAPRAAAPSNGNGAPTGAPRPAPGRAAQPAPPRRPVNPAPIDEDDLPF